ncbi:MAG: hypothetical protein J6S21_05780, partial [Victivallales bacterium]|nr:hypothetical protein [Victivallales bacterium]
FPALLCKRLQTLALHTAQPCFILLSAAKQCFMRSPAARFILVRLQPLALHTAAPRFILSLIPLCQFAHYFQKRATEQDFHIILTTAIL